MNEANSASKRCDEIAEELRAAALCLRREKWCQICKQEFNHPDLHLAVTHVAGHRIDRLEQGLKRD